MEEDPYLDANSQRNNSVSSPSAKEVATAIIEQMKAEKSLWWVDPELHHAQHQFIEALMKEAEKKNDDYRDLKKKILGGTALAGIVSLMGVLGSALFEFFEYVRKMLE